jgi:hypothetical protein
MFRRAMFVLAVLGLVGVCAAVAVWLGGHSDRTLTHWSLIAGVISAGLTALTAVLAMVPLIPRKSAEAPKADDGEATRVPPAEISVIQKVKHNRGAIQGAGFQLNRFGDRKR